MAEERNSGSLSLTQWYRTRTISIKMALLPSASLRKLILIAQLHSRPAGLWPYNMLIQNSPLQTETEQSRVYWERVIFRKYFIPIIFSSSLWTHGLAGPVSSGPTEARALVASRFASRTRANNSQGKPFYTSSPSWIYITYGPMV